LINGSGVVASGVNDWFRGVDLNKPANGRALTVKPFSVASQQEALQAFERALAIDPGSVDAKMGIASILVSSVGTGWSNSVQQDKARAEQLLTEALDRNASSASAHLSMGYLRRLQDRLPESKIELEMAVEIDRNYAFALTQLGTTLTLLGQPDAAIPLTEKAIRLSPHDPAVQAAYWALGRVHLLLGHVDEAIDLLRKARAANPRLAYIQFTLAAALGLKGEIDEARAVLAEGLKLKPEWNTLARYHGAGCASCSPSYRALVEKTVDVGLRRAGLPDG
jgi:adenylate cyclase